MQQKTHRSVTVARDGGGGGPTLAAGAPGGHGYLDGATGLKEQERGDNTGFIRSERP